MTKMKRNPLRRKIYGSFTDHSGFTMSKGLVIRTSKTRKVEPLIQNHQLYDDDGLDGLYCEISGNSSSARQQNLESKDSNWEKLYTPLMRTVAENVSVGARECSFSSSGGPCESTAEWVCSCVTKHAFCSEHAKNHYNMSPSCCLFNSAGEYFQNGNESESGFIYITMNGWRYGKSMDPKSLIELGWFPASPSKPSKKMFK
jgi:hypothetical protein